MFLGIIIPLVVITGPVATLLEGLASFGEDGVDAMNIIIWVPVLIMLICLIEGRKLLPKTLTAGPRCFWPPPSSAATAAQFPSSPWPAATP